MTSKGFPIPVPFGGGGNKDLIIVTKDRGLQYLNLIGKSRYSVPDGIDALMILTIAENDPGTQEMINRYSAFTIAQDGLGRSEHMMVSTGVLAPKSMPQGLGKSEDEDDNNKHRMPWNRNGHNKESNNEELGAHV